MKCTILHETRGRMRVRLCCRRMTLEQAASLAVEFVLACIDATARDPQAGWYGVEFEKALPLLCERVRELPEN